MAKLRIPGRSGCMIERAAASSGLAPRPAMGARGVGLVPITPIPDGHFNLEPIITPQRSAADQRLPDGRRSPTDCQAGGQGAMGEGEGQATAEGNHDRGAKKGPAFAGPLSLGCRHDVVS
jgi:hypothetical protein